MVTCGPYIVSACHMPFAHSSSKALLSLILGFAAPRGRLARTQRWIVLSEKSAASMVPSAMRRRRISTQFILGWASLSARMAASTSGPILRDFPASLLPERTRPSKPSLR